MNAFSIKRKPDYISWEQLAECQQHAHKSNKNKGVLMKSANYTADELRNAVKDGITLVALDDAGALVGELSILYKQVNRWWHKGTAAYICYVAVIPEYQGKGVYSALSKLATELVLQDGVGVQFLNTHVNNMSARKAYEKDGYKRVRFSPGSRSDYYSVEMAKWLSAKKNSVICRLMFLITEFLVRLYYKPGKIRRF